MTFTADCHAPTKYFDEDLKEIANNSQVRLLSRRRQGLTTAFRRKYGFVRNAPTTDPLVEEKASVDTALHAVKRTFEISIWIAAAEITSRPLRLQP